VRSGRSESTQNGINAAIRHRPELGRARLEHVAKLMNSAVPDCLVTGFESGHDLYSAETLFAPERHSGWILCRDQFHDFILEMKGSIEIVRYISTYFYNQTVLNHNENAVAIVI